MKRLITLTVAVMLAACGPYSKGTDSGYATQRLQQLVQEACGWEPIAETLVSLLPGVSAGEGIAKIIAEAICDKVKSTPAPAAAGAPMEVTLANGTVVKGSYKRI